MFALCHFLLSTRICLRFTLSSKPGVFSFDEFYLWIAFLFLIVINLGNFKENQCFLLPIWAQWESLAQFKSFIIRKWMAWMHHYLLTFKGKWIMEWNLKSGINVCALTRLFINLKFISTHIFYIFFFSFLQRNIFVPKMGCFENLTSGRQLIQSLYYCRSSKSTQKVVEFEIL